MMIMMELQITIVFFRRRLMVIISPGGAVEQCGFEGGGHGGVACLGAIPVSLFLCLSR